MRRLSEYGIVSGTFIATTKFGFRMEVNRLDAVKWCIYYFGWFEPQISLAWKALLKPGSRVLDVGGNVGYHALLAAKCVGSHGQVVTFEPSKKIYDQLVRNVRLNEYAQVDCRHAAISNRCGTVKLYFAGANLQGNSSIMEARKTAVSEDVAALTFNEVGAIIPLAEVDLIKIDVEGAENLVVESLVRFLSDLKESCVIFIEITSSSEKPAEELLAPFLAFGFSAKLIKNRYETDFYMKDQVVEFEDFRPGTVGLLDVVLTRRPELFAVMENGAAM
jgi:FkbM family methyltransferase